MNMLFWMKTVSSILLIGLCRCVMKTGALRRLQLKLKISATGAILQDPVGCVFFTRYSPESAANYEFLSVGQGVVEIIAQTIAIRRNSEFAIKKY